jgi:anti-sigma regulatory factor (Ser/Thr protein kinase)
VNNAENQIFRLNIIAKVEYLTGAIALVREVLTKLGLDDKDTRRMELVVEEACVNVIEHAFEDESGNFDIIVSRRPGQIIIGVEDRGLPQDFNKLENSDESGLGIVLMKAFADEVQFLNLGRQGKRVELVKNLPEKDIKSLLKESDTKATTTPLNMEGYVLRFMRPDEAVNLARCAYRCYGYTYSTDILYFPERIKERIESSMMTSAVAVTAEGEIIGHFALTRDTPDSLVGERGQAIVDPRCRGNGILKQVGNLLSDFCRENFIFGSFSEAVTVHTYTQRAELSGGATEMGILIGFTPATMFFKGIQQAENRKRRPIVLFYKRLNEEPFREVYLPPHHAGILRRIYQNSGLLRSFITGTYEELPEHSQVNIKVQTEASRAFLQVLEYGQDLESVIKYRLKELYSKHIDCIYLDLPLSNPAVQRYCAAMEMLGFFFGGVLPETSDGDVLRLQFINTTDVEIKDVHLHSDFSKEMFRYILDSSGLVN